MEIPSPFVSLSLDNSQIASMTSWTLSCTVGGDDTKNINISAFEALIYSAAQKSTGSDTASIPVSFMFGWLDSSGNVNKYKSYQGFSLKYSVSTTGQYLQYTLTGYATLAVQTHMPVLNIPKLKGIVQPSAVLEGLAIATKATNYYDLDIDHNDAPTYISHGALNTSFNTYVSGNFSGKDDYDSFPGLVTLSKSYNSTREASGLNTRKAKKLSTVLNNASLTPISNFLHPSNSDTSLQCASFSYWVEEPTMTSKGVIHYKSDGGRMGDYTSSILQYGTANSNILSLSGKYDGVAYNMTDMNFQSLGFSLDGSGKTIANDATVVNSWSSSLAGVFQTANIINDINALASQFSGDFTITIPGSVDSYALAQPVSLIVMSGNTLSPISGIYNIVSVQDQISNTFLTVLKVQRLVMSSANQVASSQGITIGGTHNYAKDIQSTSNIISPGKVDFGNIYPTFDDIRIV